MSNDNYFENKKIAEIKQWKLMSLIFNGETVASGYYYIFYKTNFVFRKWTSKASADGVHKHPTVGARKRIPL